VCRIRILIRAPISIRLNKQAMQKTYELDLEAAVQLETNNDLECHDSEDFWEGERFRRKASARLCW
jgi:hypothetical protein